jgi:diguanylate cyclase (GGDEF)-like protein
MNEQLSMGILISSLFWIIMMYLFFRKWKLQKENLINSHNRFVHVVENSTDFIYYAQVYPEVRYKYLSPSAENFFGEGSIAGAYISPEVAFMDIHPDDFNILISKIKGELDFSKGIIQRWKDKDGNYRWFEEYATPTYENGKLVALQGVLRCIDEKIELQNQLEYRLYHDNLTNLYNREYFEVILERYNQQINTPIALIICDLDELKYFNDNYGHKEGDALIKETAKLLNQFSSENIVVARLGGDEFVLLVPEKTEKEIEQLVSEILKEIVCYNGSDSGTKLKVQMSIGYAFSPFSIGQMTEIFSRADKNMYLDKVSRKKLII